MRIIAVEKVELTKDGLVITDRDTSDDETSSKVAIPNIPIVRSF